MRSLSKPRCSVKPLLFHRFFGLSVFGSISLLTLCISCGFFSNDESYQKIKPLQEQLHPFGVKVFHTSQDTTALYLQLNSKTQSFAYTDSGRIAKLTINYTLATDQSMARVLLNKKHTFHFYKQTLMGDTIFRFPLLIKTGDHVYLEVQVKDEVSKRLFQKDFTLQKDDHSPHNLMITHLNKPVFTPFLTVGKKYIFHYKDRAKRKFYVFQTAEHTSQTRFMELPSHTPTSFKGVAYYRLCLSEQETSDCRLLPVMRPGFPHLFEKKYMLAPLGLLVSDSSEYHQVSQSGDVISQVELFWLQLAKSDMYLAKKLIKTFYRRYEYANLFYTSLRPGWQTDIGKAYVLFGYPSTILDHPDEQKWNYGFSNTSFPYNLTFKKEEIHGVTSYQIVADDGFLEMLNLAKLHWRRGVIFDDDVIKAIQHEKEEDQKRQFANPWGAFRY